MKAHPSAIIDPKAKLASSVTVGPYAVIGADVEIGDDTEVMSHAVLGGPTVVGRENRIFPFASIGLEPQDLKYRGEKSVLKIGDGNTIREFVSVHRGTADAHGLTVIGNRNLLMATVHIAHDCVLGDGIIMANGAALAGHVDVGDYASLGAYCGVHQFTRIGAHCFIGAFTAVNRDILPYSLSTVDRPITVLGPNKVGLERRGIAREEIAELDKAFRLLSRSKLNSAQALEAIEARNFGSPHVKVLVEFVRSSTRGVAK